jgi:hypothetical protein
MSIEIKGLGKVAGKGKTSDALTKRSKGRVLSAKDNQDGTCTIHVEYAKDDDGNFAPYQSNGKSLLLANINGTLLVNGHEVKVRGNLLI